MKKTSLLNIALSETIAGLGHGDMLVIADAGLPVPPQTRLIDLALTRGIPGFRDTLRVVLDEMQVEEAIIADETEQVSPAIYQNMQELLPALRTSRVSHEALKQITVRARAVVRTGEFTPYANIILVSGVVF
jgi:D-ribose pyranase